MQTFKLITLFVVGGLAVGLEGKVIKNKPHEGAIFLPGLRPSVEIAQEPAEGGPPHQRSPANKIIQPTKKIQRRVSNVFSVGHFCIKTSSPPTNIAKHSFCNFLPNFYSVFKPMSSKKCKTVYTLRVRNVTTTG